MRVVMSGYFGFDNVGDEAILFSIIRALRKWEPAVEITVLSNNPEETAATYGVQAINRWKLGQIRTALKSADGLISGGGSLMQDQTSGKTIPYYAAIIKMAQLAKVPVFVYAQGMGPINKGLNKWIVKSVFNKCAGITVRDEESRALLETIGVRSNVAIVPDPVVGLGGEGFTSKWLDTWRGGLVKAGAGVDDSDLVKAGADSALVKVGADSALVKAEKIDVEAGDYITVSVRDWPTDVDYKAKIAVSLDALAATGYSIVFIPMHGEHDAKSSADVARMMHAESTIAPADLPIEEKIAVIGQSKLLIGQRLHSLIFSAIEHTPFIALSYDPKIDAFANIVNQPIIGHVEVDDWDGEMLAAKATALLENHDSESAKLATLIERLQVEAELTAKLALNAF